MTNLSSLLSNRLNMLALAVVLVLASGLGLNASTTAYFTTTAAVGSNTLASANLALSGPGASAFSFYTGSGSSSSAVAGDIFKYAFTIQNTGSVNVPYFFTTKATTSTNLDTNTSSGLQMVLLRCSAACATATSFTTVAGVMNGVSASVTTTGGGGPPTAAATALSGNSLVFNGGNVSGGPVTIAAVPILTHNNPGNGVAGQCAAPTNDGGCLLGGATAISAGNPATTAAVSVDSTTLTADVAANASPNGLAAGATDNLLLYVFLPTAADFPTFGNLASNKVAFAFTAVQPNGTLH